MSTGDRTKTFLADNTSTADPITVQSFCNEVVIQENAKANTTSYKIYDPSLSSGPVTKAIGEAYVFRRKASWYPGDTIGYIETVDASSATFSQEERQH